MSKTAKNTEEQKKANLDMLRDLGIKITDKPLNQVDHASGIIYKDPENKKKSFFI